MFDLQTWTAMDHRVFFWVNNGWSNNVLDGIFEAISGLGAWPIGIVALAFLAGCGRRAFRRHAAVLLLFLVLSSGSNTLLKNTFNRARPITVFAEELAAGTRTIHILEARTPAKFSFPSGHSMLAFFFMVYIGLWRRRYAPYALLLALLIALSRVYVGAHFPSDCLVGSLIGSGWGALAWRAFEHERRVGT